MSFLLSIPSPGPEWSYFDLGMFRIHAYALCILAGIIAATVMTSRRLTNRGAEPGVVLDIILWAVPLGIVGARAFHVLTHPADYFYVGANPWEVFAIWNGGNAIFGALIGGAVGAYIGCRISGVKFWSFADALAPGMLIAQAMGRLGNWFNTELFGLPTTLPWGLEVPSTNPAFPVGLPAGTLFHPTFLYEMIWNTIGVIVILLIERRITLRWGRAFGVYLVWYGLGRSFFESIRIDPSEIYFGIRTNVWAAIIAVILGVILIVVQGRRHPGLEVGVHRPGREWKRPVPEVESEEFDTDFEDHGDEAVEPAASGDVAATSTSNPRLQA